MARGPRYTEIKNIPSYSGAGVYALVDTKGRKYIGSTINVHRRIQQHCGALRYRKAHKKLQEAFNRGETFTAEVLHCLPETVTIGELRQLEHAEMMKLGGPKGTYNSAYPNTWRPRTKATKAYREISEEDQKAWLHN